MAECKSSGRSTSEEVEIKGGDFTLLTKVIEHIGSARVRSEMDSFRDRHAHIFTGCESSECTFEQTSVFKEFVELLEGEMESLLTASGANHKEFYKQCQEVVAGAFTALFEVNENAWFIDLLHSWSDFELFRRDMIAWERTRMRGESKSPGGK